MKTSDKLKIMAIETATIIDESADVKIKTMKYIKEKANPHQCMGFILDGKLYNLDEFDKMEIEERFINEQGDLTYHRKTAHSVASGVAGAVTGGVLLFPIYRAIRAAFSQCTKACGVLSVNTSKRQYCMISCKVEQTQKEISMLQSYLSKCQDDSCKSKISSKLAAAKQKLGKYLKKQAKMKSWMMKKGKDISNGDEKIKAF